MKPATLRFGAIALLASFAILSELSAATPLDHERRVDAHRAVERVLWEQRIWPESNPGPKPPLEEVLPDSALRDSVDDVLRKSSALATLWGRPVGNRALQVELDRMVRDSREPETLADMLDALDRDPVLAADVIARPALVDRLIRSWYASDGRYHGSVRQSAEAALATAVSGQDLARVAPRYETTTWTLGDAEWENVLVELAERFAEDRSPHDTVLEGLPVGRIAALRETDEAFSATVVLEKSDRSVRIGVGSWPKTPFDTWWSSERSKHEPVLSDPDTGAPAIRLAPLHDPSAPCSDDKWFNTETGAPWARARHSAVWTGSEMIVWGGIVGDGTTAYDTGGRYRPATDSWSAMSMTGAPSPRSGHDAIWTGSQMIVWGGVAPPNTPLSTGARYDPTSDSWTPTSSAGAPTWSGTFALHALTGVWTGTVMVVWDHVDFNDPVRGFKYDPWADSWLPITTTGAPQYDDNEVVWTGSHVIVWPGRKYDPTADTWSELAFLPPHPAARYGHSLVWTGSRMILWGGRSESTNEVLNDGMIYDPASGTWSSMSSAVAPQARYDHQAVWVGGRMVVWGGRDGGSGTPPLQTGGRYDPSANTWLPTTLTDMPDSRWDNTAITTTSEMIVWGGYVYVPGSGYSTNTGARYDPQSNTWVPTRVGSLAPGPRSQHSAVWTGGEMILWGGADAAGFLSTGYSYQPSTDTWWPLSGGVAPSARVAHTAVWTGSAMLVWGGWSGTFASTGGAFRPGFGWSPIQNSGAPSARMDATAVWTGSRMLVWGGSDGSGALGTGGIYDPSSNVWGALPTTGAPTPRAMHSAVWTGSSMIVWGGAGGGYVNTGGRFDPATNAWSGTSTAGAPVGRRQHAAAWTGSRMLIWGGNDGSDLGSGASYDPAGDSWSPISAAAAPQARSLASAVWSGTEMIVWGGRNGVTALGTGGRYFPDTDSWRPTSTVEAPHARAFHTAAWGAGKMMVWGGMTTSGGHWNNGGKYCTCVTWYDDGDGDGYGDPQLDSTNCAGARPEGTVAWAGDCDDADPAIHPGVSDHSCNGVDEDCDSQFDEDYLPQPSACGQGVCRQFGSFDCIGGQIQNSCVPAPPNSPTDDSCNTLDDDCDGPVDEDFQQREDYWSPLSTVFATARTNHTAVSLGGNVIVFGGDNGSGSVIAGGSMYLFGNDFWMPLAAGPAKRWRHTAVWTGSHMIVWGGDDNVSTIYNNGGRYDVANDSWAATSTTNAPSARFAHSAVWTGSRMIVWGGVGATGYVNTGSRYDPVANSWSATATSGSPAVRAGHSAVWTGTEMIVWGGQTTGQTALGTGARYNATTNTWSAVATSGAPSARYGHVAVWTGSHMVIWGGTDGSTYFATGARYDPASNTWSPVSAVGAPGRRAFAAHAFTGTELIVWGGTFRTNEVPDTPRADGARYNPWSDTWVAMNDQLSVPAARARAVGAWTIHGMVVWGGDPNGGALASGGVYRPREECGTGDCWQVGSTFCSSGAIGFVCQPLTPTPETCDGHDNDCDGVADDAVPVPMARPNVLAARIPGGDTELSWAATPDTTHYDVVRGGLGMLVSSAGNFTTSFDLCRANDIPAPTTRDSATPPAGNGYWYLVRPVNLCSGNGTYDGAIPPQVGLHDAEIAAAAGACP